MAKSNINWRKATTEFVIIVVGVLAALAIDQWNNDRLDRILERKIVHRLIEDLRADLAGIDFGLSAMPRKMESLQRVQSVLAAETELPQIETMLLQDVISGAGYGWNQVRARRTTYDELLGSGRLALIQDSTIRESISEYYAFDIGIYNRIDERETQYPPISYQLVPRDAEYKLQTGLSGIEQETLIENVLASDLRNHVTAELNLAVFIEDEFANFHSLCTQLIAELESYLLMIS